MALYNPCTGLAWKDCIHGNLLGGIVDKFLEFVPDAAKAASQAKLALEPLSVFISRARKLYVRRDTLWQVRFNRLPDLKMSQHRKTGGSREQMLERMAAQNEICIHRVVGSLKQLGKRIEGRGQYPV